VENVSYGREMLEYLISNCEERRGNNLAGCIMKRGNNQRILKMDLRKHTT
jgi:hypothetical protein